jgi:type IV pilus assembly protein PilN
MIKINLLAEERGKKTKGGAQSVVMAPVAGEAGPVPLPALLGIILLFALATVGMVGWFYFQNIQLERRVVQQKEELKKYEAFKKKVDELNKKKTEYQAKLDQITELKKKQPYPVLLMNRLVEILPEGVWYTSLTNTKDGIKVEGKARGLKTVSTFYDSAVSIPDFVNASKGMGNIKQDSALGDVYSFTMNFAFVPGGPKDREEAQAAAGGKQKPGKGGKKAAPAPKAKKTEGGV